MPAFGLGIFTGKVAVGSGVFVGVLVGVSVAVAGTGEAVGVVVFVRVEVGPNNENEEHPANNSHIVRTENIILTRQDGRISISCLLQQRHLGLTTNGLRY